MKKSILVAGMVLSLVVILLMTGCQKKDKGTIKIGAILPLTGNLAQNGIAPQQGMLIAADEINNAGGINGKKIELIFEDSQGKPDLGLSAYQKLSSIQQIKYYFTSLTGVSMAIKDKIKGLDALQIVFAMTESITDSTNNVLRIYPGMIEEGNTVLEAIKGQNVKRVAILSLKHEAYTQQIDRILEPGLKNANIELVSHEEFDANNITSLPEIVLKIKKTKPEMIYISGYANFMLPIVKSLQESGILKTSKVISGMTLPIAVQNKSVPESAVEGFYVASPTFFQDVSNVSSKVELAKLTQTLKTRFKSDMTIDAITGYVSLKILAEGLMKDGSSPIKTIEAIKSIKTFKGIDNNINVLPNGSCEWPWSIGSYKNGKLNSVR
jgi:branched-chain amino acid transport system substrate-binding protein